MIGIRAILAAAGRVAGGGGGVAVTWNPENLEPHLTLTNNNLTVTSSEVSDAGHIKSTEGKNSGKFYWEIFVNQDAQYADTLRVGLALSTLALTATIGANSSSWAWTNSGKAFHNGSNTTGLPVYTTGDVLRFTLDIGTGEMQVAVNAGSFVVYPHTITAGDLFIAASPNWLGSVTARFKSADFTYTPPGGFSAWES